MALTPRERVERTFRRESVDRVPFTIYTGLLPWRTTAERRLRNDGLCLVARAGTFSSASPNVKTKHIQFVGPDGFDRRQTVIKTPRGTLTSTMRVQGIAHTYEERLFKSPDDYAALIAMVEDRRYTPDYDAFTRAREAGGDDCFTLSGIGYSPLQEIIFVLMGIEGFSIEWAERRDDVLKLHDALTEDRRRVYPIIAESPAHAVNYGGNVSPEIMGLERFEKYVVPHYDEMAEALHKTGKLVGVHMDANNLLFADALARSSIDYVEAFTPPPDCDMSVAQARQAWPDKILWINFPSSVHLAPAEKVKEATRQILREAAPGDGFMVGVTEDIPEDRWQISMAAVSEVLRAEGRLPLGG